MTFNFKEQKEVGNKGEIFLIDYSPDELTRLDGRNHDLVTKLEVPCLKQIVHIEVKTDDSKKAREYFDEGKDPNSFIERYSDQSKKSPGGPWQSFSKGNPIYFYLYWYKKLAYVFNTEELIQRLELLIPDKKPYPVPNRSYITSGYIVPKHELEDIMVEIDLTKPGQKLIPIFDKLLSKNQVSQEQPSNEVNS